MRHILHHMQSLIDRRNLHRARFLAKLLSNRIGCIEQLSYLRFNVPRMASWSDETICMYQHHELIFYFVYLYIICVQTLMGKNLTGFNNLNKQRAKTRLELSRNRLQALTGFLTKDCYIGKHIASIGLKQNSMCRFCGVKYESSEHLTSNHNYRNSCQPAR